MRLLAIVWIVGSLIVAGSAWAGYPPTDYEQYMLEVINRARRDPDGEVYRLRGLTWGDTSGVYARPQPPDLNEGISTNLLTHESRQPLAFNDKILQAARDYSQTLLDHDAFEHEYGDTTPYSRMKAAGYAFSGNWGWGENLALKYANYALSISASLVDGQYNGLFVDGNFTGRGHRRNLVDGGMKEIGIGIAGTSTASYTPPGGSGNWYAVITTQDFAYSDGSSGGKAMLTGVAYSDAGTDNSFYDPGEGLGGVTVTATPAGGGAASSATTWTSGGYSLPLSPGAYHVTFSGGGLASPITYANTVIGSTNVKLDASSDLGVWKTDGNGDWSTAANWSGVVPSGTGKAAGFAGKATAPRTINLNSPQTVGTLSFNNSSAGYTISGGSTLTLQMAADSARIAVDSGGHTIGVPVRLASGLDVTVLGAADWLTLSGPISSPSAEPLVKLGKGTLRLTGNNSSYGGGLTIADGTLMAGVGSALGSETVTLGFGSNNTSLLADTAATAPNAIQVAAGPGGTRTLGTTLTSGTAAFSGAITLNHDLFLTAPGGGSIVLSGVIRGDGGLVKGGAGTGILTAVNSYTGGTVVSGGILRISAAGGLPAGRGLTIDSGGTVVLQSGVSASGVSTVAVPEPSSLALLGIGGIGLLACGWGRWKRFRTGTEFTVAVGEGAVPFSSRPREA